MTESIEASEWQAQEIENYEESETEKEGWDIQHHLNDPDAVCWSPFDTDGEAEGQECEWRDSECEDIVARMVVPAVLNINQTFEIQANAMCLELGVGGWENSDDEIEKHDHVDEEIDC